MRTLIVLLLGSLAAVAAILLTKPARRPLARMIFCNSWLVLCMVSLRNAVAHGNLLVAEVPIHLLLFALPAAFTIRLTRRAPGTSAT